jgi:ABC-2 type transport system permease protein
MSTRRSSWTVPIRMGATDVSAFEVGGSLLVLALAIGGVSWVAGKIYRIGILSTGKRPSVGELWRWVRAA